MPRTRKPCVFESCKYFCIQSSYRTNFLRAFPDGYPARGSGVYVCRECKYPCTEAEMEVDHLKPQARGGTNCVVNLQPLCGSKTSNKCNQKKGKTYEFKDKLAKRVSPVVRRKVGNVMDMFSRLTITNS